MRAGYRRRARSLVLRATVLDVMKSPSGGALEPMFLFYLVAYAAIFDLIYGLAAVLLVMLPIIVLGLIVAFFDVPISKDVGAALVMLLIVPWKGATLWSAFQAARRAVSGASFFGAMRETLSEARAYLTLVPIVGRVFGGPKKASIAS